MFLAKVSGNLVATQKDLNLVGHKLLVTRPINIDGDFISEKDVISLDLIISGIGDIVIVVQEGDAVQQILNSKTTPVNTMIIAIVDDLEINE